jgi:hypothetical protein
VNYFLKTVEACLKTRNMFEYSVYMYVVAQLVEALRYKPKGRGFDSGWGL